MRMGDWDLAHAGVTHLPHQRALQLDYLLGEGSEMIERIREPKPHVCGCEMTGGQQVARIF